MGIFAKRLATGLPTTDQWNLDINISQAGYSRRKAVIGSMLKARRAGM